MPMSPIPVYSGSDRKDQNLEIQSFFEQALSYPQLSYKVRGLQVLSLLLGLVTLASSIVLSGCGGIAANASAKSGGGSAGSLTVSSSTVAFGSVTIGSPATTQITLTNSTSSDVVISALTLSSNAFTVDGLSTLPATVAAKGSAKLNVHFNPSATGSASGQLVIANNSLVSPSLTVALTGSGASGGSGTQSGAALSVNASSIAFGSIGLTTPGTQSLTLSSTGSAAVTVSSVAASGTGFSVSGATFPLTLNPGQTATLSIQFKAAAAGSVTGSLTIKSNASSTSTITVALSATGVSRAVDLNWSGPSNSSSAVSGYNIYRATGTSSSFQKLNSSVDQAASFVDGSVQATTTYQYYVTTVDSSGMESTPSNTATVAVP